MEDGIESAIDQPAARTKLFHVEHFGWGSGRQGIGGAGRQKIRKLLNQGICQNCSTWNNFSGKERSRTMTFARDLETLPLYVCLWPYKRKNIPPISNGKQHFLICIPLVHIALIIVDFWSFYLTPGLDIDNAVMNLAAFGEITKRLTTLI